MQVQTLEGEMHSVFMLPVQLKNSPHVPFGPMERRRQKAKYDRHHTNDRRGGGENVEIGIASFSQDLGKGAYVAPDRGGQNYTRPIDRTAFRLNN